MIASISDIPQGEIPEEEEGDDGGDSDAE